MYPGPDYGGYGFGETELKPAKKNPISNLLGKFKGKMKMVLVGGVVLVVLVWFLFLSPKPGILRLNVVQMDSETNIDGDVTVLSGGKTIASGSTSDGVLRLDKIPSGDVTIQLTPATGYKEISKTVKLGSGEEKTVLVEVPLDYELEMPSQTNLSAGIGCSSKINLEVRNVMSAAANVSFIAEGDIATWIETSSGAVDAKKVKSYDMRVEVPADYELAEESEEKLGSIRINGTEIKMDVSIVLLPGGELEVDSEELALEGKAGEKIQEKVALTNNGVGKVADIKANASGEIADWIKVSLGKTTLDEDEDTQLTINVNIPTNASEGTHEGVIDVSSGCGEKEIKVEVEVSALEVELQTEPNELSSEVYAGNSDLLSLRITNPSQIEVSATIGLRGEFGDWVTLSDEIITLAPSGSETVSVSIDPSFEVSGGTYSGRVEIGYLGKTANVPLIVTVLGEGSVEE